MPYGIRGVGASKVTKNALVRRAVLAGRPREITVTSWLPGGGCEQGRASARDRMRLALTRMKDRKLTGSVPVSVVSAKHDGSEAPPRRSQAPCRAIERPWCCPRWRAGRCKCAGRRTSHWLSECPCSLCVCVCVCFCFMVRSGIALVPFVLLKLDLARRGVIHDPGPVHVPVEGRERGSAFQRRR